MAEIILICGNICSGKTTYAKKLMKERKAILLSCDEIMLSLFGQHLGDKHEEIADRTKKYIYNKAVEIYGVGISVIIDLGFFRKSERSEIVDYCEKNSMNYTWHYVKVSKEQWDLNINKRNEDIEKGINNDYYIDDNLKNKILAMFEEPNEINFDYIETWGI